MKRAQLRIIEALRQSAGARSTAYLTSMVGVLLTCYRLPHDPANPFDTHVHPQAFPGVIAITDLFTRLREEDRTAWTRPISQADISDLTRGIVLGAAASASVFGVAALKGWVSFPAWGWQNGPTASTVVAAAGLTAAQTAVLVANEEIIFRGYGLDTLRAALGLPLATLISTALFARYHGPGGKRFLGLSAAGLLLTLLRLRSGTLWFAAGFHYGWNLWQSSICGPSNGAPSLRPVHLHGPSAWVGQPGRPEPGWLQIIATWLMVVIAGVEVWRAGKTADSQ
jgi:membrane protease YdiL (CAAX protease family)